MKAAQIAFAALVAVLVASSTVLFVVDETVAAWVMAGFGLFGYLMLVGMIATDRRPQPPGLGR